MPIVAGQMQTVDIGTTKPGNIITIIPKAQAVTVGKLKCACWTIHSKEKVNARIQLST
jgi:hypothetical protein